eukprot:366278-Chlamydomonas_euryale.AAC.56
MAMLRRLHERRHSLSPQTRYAQGVTVSPSSKLVPGIRCSAAALCSLIPPVVQAQKYAEYVHMQSQK